MNTLWQVMAIISIIVVGLATFVQTVNLILRGGFDNFLGMFFNILIIVLLVTGRLA